MTEDGGGASRSTDPAAGSSAATDVSLREYLNEKIHADRKLNNERFAFAAALGGVIWFFIERHLSDLNHENARVAKVSESSVSSDTYNANEQQRKAELDKRDEWQGRVDAALGRGVNRDEFQRDTRELTRDERTDRRVGYSLSLQVLAGGIGVILFMLVVFTTYRAIKPSIPVPQSTVTVTTTPAVP